ncbi:hypothetical protein LMG29660_01434 [Burkholderia puraquae]|uniref:Uncharacterized protein n=1 Tax=Burkholderia puraquae TaxID=1904757 RepID=A0A6J5DAP0_9BURK|nr:hypothetical protein LMG29660_01434 [Burkholderia puraquae]
MDHVGGRNVASNGEKLTFAGEAIIEVNFDNPEWQNGFEHDPEAAAAARIALFNEAAEAGALLAAAQVAFPSIGHIAKNGDGFRCVPVLLDY